MALGEAMHEVRQALEPQPAVGLTQQQLEDMQRMMQPRWQEVLEQKIAARELQLAPSAATQLAQLEIKRLELIPKSKRTGDEIALLEQHADTLEFHRLELENFVKESQELRWAAASGIEPEILPSWAK